MIRVPVCPVCFPAPPGVFEPEPTFIPPTVLPSHVILCSYTMYVIDTASQ
jgi:hypothetical protein